MQMMSTAEIYQRSEKFISSDLGEAMILTNIDGEKFYGTNAVGLHIWELLKSPVSLNELVEALLQVFNVEKARCAAEVESFMNELAHAGAIQKVSG